MDKKYKIIISGGGTGGHIFPAIAIAHALTEAEVVEDLLFVGATGKMEMEKVPQAGYKIIGLPIAGLQRRLTLSNLWFPIKLIHSLWQAQKIVNRFKPHIAIGVGGYASGPILLVCALAGIPTLIQEQNSYAGLTNKWLARAAKKICVAYPNMEKYFPKHKIILTGNPVRKNISSNTLHRETALATFGFLPNKKTIFVIGGSLGAKTLNNSIAAYAEDLIKNNIQVIWQTGKSYHPEAVRLVDSLKAHTILSVHDFIKEMNTAYTAADIIISRAGAMAISELSLVGKPCILVPSPNVTDDHQTKNAMALVNMNAAILVADSNAEKELIPTAIRLLNDTSKQEELCKNIAAFARPDAAQKIATEIIKLIQT